MDKDSRHGKDVTDGACSRYQRARGMPRFLLRLPKSQTKQLHVALIVSLRRHDQTIMGAVMPVSYQWPNASCSRNDESKLARMRSNLCCSHHVLGIRTKLRRQEQLSAFAASYL